VCRQGCWDWNGHLPVCMPQTMMMTPSPLFLLSFSSSMIAGVGGADIRVVFYEQMAGGGLTS
jgi:hypothetical protein